MTDSHSHLNHPKFARDRQQVIGRARAAGVDSMVVVGYDLESSQVAIKLSEADSCLWATVGLHPHDARLLDDAMLAHLRALAGHPRVVAIGEVGLDFYRDLSPREQQRDAFRRLIALSHELGLPLIVHDREAHEEVLEVLRSEGAGQVVLHCFSGDAAMAEQAITMGCYLGIAGPVTYGSARKLAAVIAQSLLERLLLETDCPYLPPLPHRRSERNEPAWIVDIAQQVAEIRGLPVDTVAQVTADNVKKAFPRMAAVG